MSAEADENKNKQACSPPSATTGYFQQPKPGSRRSTDAPLTFPTKMRGLAFPSNAILDREPSYENGSPNNVEDIPIDPALGGPAIGPAFIVEDVVSSVAEKISPVIVPSHPLPPLQDEYVKTRHYSQGPQGDPFAPQPLPTYIPIQPEHVARPQKLNKRKRKPRREEECGFCQGSDEKNKDNMPELMATCDDCGRSGHPSCMGLTEIGDVIRKYPWKCTECKNCEICQEKGDDDRILFCDFCDRGWHMDCMDPPIQEAPTGSWHCPICPPVPQEHPLHPEPEVHASPFPPAERARETSVASSSKMSMQLDGAVSRGKGKAPVVVVSSDDSDSEEDMDVDVISTAQGRMRAQQKKFRGRPPKVSIPANSGAIESPTATKRMKLRVSSPSLPKVRLRLPALKGKRRDREEDDGPRGMFDDILTPDDRDMSKTSIRDADKQMFDRSRVLAEAKSAPPPPPPPQSQASEPPDQPHAGPSRPLRSTTSCQAPIFVPNIDTSISPTPTTPITNTEPTKPRIRTIRFGDYDIQTWYDAPFPEEYATMPDGRLWICEFCLKYMKSKFGAVRHRLKCKARHPPGDEIYRDEHVSIFEVDGRKNKIYCQHLCLLSKMFLDHKSLFYDVEPFLFYVITEVDEIGARFVGYFSKEKRSPKDYNVSCIMTLPVRQRQGWGNLLIDFSYLLSKKEQRLGSPEKPLSALGAIGYKKYWTLAVMKFLQTAPDNPTLQDISQDTSMTVEDVFNTLIELNMISYRAPSPPPVRPSPGQSIKFPKGRRNGIARRQSQRTLTSDNKEAEASNAPFVPPTHYEIRWDHTQVDEFLRAWESKGYVKLKPEKLQWSPYILSRNMKIEAIDTPLMPALPTVDNLNGDENVNGLSQYSPAPDSPRSISEEVGDIIMASKVRRTRSISKSPVKRPAQDTPSRLLRGTSSQAVSLGPTGGMGDEVESNARGDLASQGLNSPDNDDGGQPWKQIRWNSLVPSRASPRKRRRFETFTPETEEALPPTNAAAAAAAAAIFDEPLVEEEVVLPVNGRQEKSPAQVTVLQRKALNDAHHRTHLEKLQRPDRIITLNGHSDIKSEDTGTPLTNTAGHPSGAASDDTVCGLNSVIDKIREVNNGGHASEEIKSEDEESEKDADGESDDEEENTL